MNMDDDLLAAAREKRDELRKQAKAARAAADDIEDEYHRADDAVATLEGIKRNLDEFNESARDLLKDK